MSIKYVIVDDEPIAHRIIEEFAGKLKQMEKAGNCYDAFEAIKLLQERKINVVFLDINMPELSGFELLNTLSDPPKVIITSAYQEYALTGYEFDVVDYLLKPFSFERFLKAINKLNTSEEAAVETLAANETNYIFLKADKKQHRVLLTDILFIEAYGNYCKVNLPDEVILTLRKISDFEAQLNDNFARVHNSFIISKQRIKAIEGNKIYIEDHTIPVGQTYKSVLSKIFNS